MEYQIVTNKIINLLEGNNLWFELFEHTPVITSEEAAKIRNGYSQHQGTKAMIVRIKLNRNKKKFVMLVVPGDLKFDNKKIKKEFLAKDVCLASEEEVSEVTGGVQIGGVPPLGNLFGLEVLVDPTVLLNEKIIFSAGDRRISIAMKSEDYKNLVKPQIAVIV
jgi:prolyl-tRNA editing enzyme YbaK/EbsC (Cys-tRNA(Pro) deacylase)